MHSDATLLYLLSHDVTAFVSRYVEMFIATSTRVYLKTAGVIFKKINAIPDCRVFFFFAFVYFTK